MSNAENFFYPNRLWGGYSRFYEPCIPGRVGDELILAIRHGLSTGDITKAVHMLSTSFYKNKHAVYGEVIGVVECIPTETALTAIQLLKDHAAEMKR